jgi:DNA uptake protein ComE-like DNA-binding protein
VTSVEAEAIVAYRLANGAFHSLKDLEKVPGLDMRKIGAVKELIEF